MKNDEAHFVSMVRTETCQPARRLRQETTMSLSWIAKRLKMGWRLPWRTCSGMPSNNTNMPLCGTDPFMKRIAERLVPVSWTGVFSLLATLRRAKRRKHLKNCQQCGLTRLRQYLHYTWDCAVGSAWILLSGVRLDS